jgi:hypothetical protein
MNNNQDNNYFRINKFVAIVVILIIMAGFGGWLLGRNNSTDSNQTNNSADENETSTTTPSGEGVKSLVTYSLPDGWKEASCESNPGSVYIIPAGAGNIDCGANPSSPVKLSVDPGNTKDCNELQNVQNVKKHVCISLYINDMRSLKATTEYLASSPYGQETTINAYYIDTGDGVIKAEYIYNSNNQYQKGFDELVNSVKAK